MKIKWWPWGFLTLVCLVLLGFFVLAILLFFPILGNFPAVARLFPADDAEVHPTGEISLKPAFLKRASEAAGASVPSPEPIVLRQSAAARCRRHVNSGTRLRCSTLCAPGRSRQSRR